MLVFCDHLSHSDGEHQDPGLILGRRLASGETVQQVPKDEHNEQQVGQLEV